MHIVTCRSGYAGSPVDTRTSLSDACPSSSSRSCFVHFGSFAARRRQYSRYRFRHGWHVFHFDRGGMRFWHRVPWHTHGFLRFASSTLADKLRRLSLSIYFDIDINEWTMHPFDQHTHTFLRTTSKASSDSLPDSSSGVKSDILPSPASPSTDPASSSSSSGLCGDGGRAKADGACTTTGGSAATNIDGSPNFSSTDDARCSP